MRLPRDLTGRRLATALSSLGYAIDRQTGSHIRLTTLRGGEHHVTVPNATSESINSKFQWVKRVACGYRNRERFRHAIYFHLGGLDLYPATLRRATHTGS